MSILISILVLLLSFSFFFIGRSTKLKIILLSILCLNFASLGITSFGSCPKMLCLFFLLSEIKYFREYIQGLNGTPFKWLMLFMTLGVFIVITTSVHAQNFNTFIGLIIADLIAKYFVIAYIFVAFNGDTELEGLYKVATIGVGIITIVGVFSLVSGIYPAQLLTDNARQIYLMSGLGRIRISSLFVYPFDYGFACNLMLIFFLYGKLKNYISNQRFYVMVLCCLVGVFICGCRTIFFTTAISLTTYFLVKNGTFKTIAYVLSFCYIGFIVYTFSDDISSKVNTTLAVLDYDHTEAGSSSLSGRETQYLTVFMFISGHELTGRGYRYFTEDLGYGKKGNGQADLEGNARKLLGLEGAIMGILLERGYIGVIFYVVFYLTVIIYALRMRNKSPSEVAVVTSCIIAFISFGNMTGELMSAIITMFLSGIFLKLAYNNVVEIGNQDNDCHLN